MKKMMWFVTALLALVWLTNTSSVAEKTAIADAKVCHSNPVGTLSSEHTGPSNVVGAFTDLQFYPDASQGTGLLTVVCQDTATPVCTPVLVQMVRVGSAARNYNVSIPCSATTQSLIPNSVCVNGMIADPTPKVTSKTVKGVTTTTTTYTPWTGKLIIAFDDDDNVLLVKLVDTSVITGVNNMCDPLWYVATATTTAAINCFTNNDCAAYMAPNPGWNPICNSTSNTCYYQYNIPMSSWVPPLGAIASWDSSGNQTTQSGPACATDSDCLAYLNQQPCNTGTPYYNATNGGNQCVSCGYTCAQPLRIFCTTQAIIDSASNYESATGNGLGWSMIPAINTCVWLDCGTDSGDYDNGTLPWCAPWQPNGTCNSTCNQ